MSIPVTATREPSKLHAEAFQVSCLADAAYQLRDVIGSDGNSLDGVIVALRDAAKKLCDDLEDLKPTSEVSK